MTGDTFSFEDRLDHIGIYDRLIERHRPYIYFLRDGLKDEAVSVGQRGAVMSGHQQQSGDTHGADARESLTIPGFSADHTKNGGPKEQEGTRPSMP